MEIEYIKSVKKFYASIDNSLQYILTTQEDKVLFVPIASGNRHYQDIQKWVAAGNTIEEAD